MNAVPANNQRPMASLSSSLLARPGHAKPAMRPQGFGHAPGDDLGWNDHGEAPDRPHTPVALTPMSAPATVPAAAPAQAAQVPPVLEERARLDEIAPAATPAPKAAKQVPVAKGETPPAANHRAAFTLRLDGDRHLKLRLASAVAGKSAQRLVTDALDAFLNDQADVANLARQLSKPNS